MYCVVKEFCCSSTDDLSRSLFWRLFANSYEWNVFWWFNVINRYSTSPFHRHCRVSTSLVYVSYFVISSDATLIWLERWSCICASFSCLTAFITTVKVYIRYRKEKNIEIHDRTSVMRCFFKNWYPDSNTECSKYTLRLSHFSISCAEVSWDWQGLSILMIFWSISAQNSQSSTR